MQKIKIAFTYVLLLIFALMAARYTLFVGGLAWQKQTLRTEAYTALKITHITIKGSDIFKNSKNLQWKDQQHEVCLNGIMYEVMGIQKKGNAYTVYLAKDVKESHWLDIFEGLDISQKKEMQNLLHLLNLIGFYLPTAKPAISQQWFTSTHFFQNPHQSIAHHHLHKLIKPPCC